MWKIIKNDEMRDRVNTVKKKNKPKNLSIAMSWSGGIRMGKELSDKLNIISKLLFLKLNNRFI